MSMGISFSLCLLGKEYKKDKDHGWFKQERAKLVLARRLQHVDAIA